MTGKKNKTKEKGKLNEKNLTLFLDFLLKQKKTLFLRIINAIAPKDVSL